MDPAIPTGRDPAWHCAQDLVKKYAAELGEELCDAAE
jgi:hypothetical protein